jgi:protein tyrosine/serine phosphatase
MLKKLLVLFLVFSAGCAYMGYIKDPFEDVPNFHKVNEALYRGGQPKPSGITLLKTKGIKSILSLRGDDNKTKNEKAFAKSIGVLFYNIPLTVFQKPTDEQVLQFLEIVLDRQNQPVYLHCDGGRDRTGAMIAFYRVVIDGWTIKNAYKESRELGFWPYHGDEALLKTFIHQLKDKQVYFQKAQELLNAQGM